MNRQEEKINKIDRFIENVELYSLRPRDEYSAEKSFSRLIARINRGNKAVEISHRRITQYRALLAVATVALLISASGLLYHMFGSEPSFVIASNHTGVVQNVPLSDGTIIKLNNHSKLIYPEHFSGIQREVFLEGEAYFDVVHDKHHPFIVRAGELTIKVLGTKFTVNANSQIPEITATLLEGSINVGNDENSVLMKPNQQLKYNIINRTMSLAELTNPAREIRWTQNIWVLSDTPLLDICQRLEQQFNIQLIIMNDELIDKSFTGEFYVNESLESILETLQISTPFQYERKGKNVILK